MPELIHFKNPFNISNDVDRDIFCLKKDENLLQFFNEQGFTELFRQQPNVVFLNGDEILEKDYDVCLRENDHVSVVPLMRGAAAGFIYAYWFEIALFVASLAITYAITPDLPTDAEQQSPSASNSLSARGNRARLNEPIPVLYGTMRVFPDLSAQPFSEFNGDGDQIVYQLFEVTQGECDVDLPSMRFDETPLSNFQDIDHEVIAPGEESLIFPASVEVSSEVSNLELGDTPLGPFVVNPPGTRVNEIAVDMVAPQGLTRQESNGDLRTIFVNFKIEIQEIDDDGNPVANETDGNFFPLGGKSAFTDGQYAGIRPGIVRTRVGDEYRMHGKFNSIDAVRVTFSYGVPISRYHVRLTRVTPVDSSIRVRDTIVWSSLKGFINEVSITDTTRIAVRVRASNQIGNKSLSKFNVVASRKLETWTELGGFSGTPVLTNNPLWAFSDACRSNYGGSRAESYIDMPAVKALADIMDSEGVEFNGIFDTKTNLWEALNRILLPARCQQIERGGVYTVVRDELETTPIQMFTMRNIVKGSFRIDYSGVVEETNDSINAIYFDEDEDYRTVEMLCVLTGGTTNDPKDLKLFGITKKSEAFKIAQWFNAQNFFRRATVSFETGIEGRIPFFHDLIRVSHFLVGRANDVDMVSGDIVAFDDINDIIDVNENVGGISTPFLVIRKKDGSPTNPLTCTVLTDFRIQITDGAFNPNDIDLSDGFERTQFSVGEGTDFLADIKVTKVTPGGEGKIRIEGFIDDVNVYTAADGLPVPPINQLPTQQVILPTVFDLKHEWSLYDQQPVITLTWQSKNSDHFQVQVSSDAGATFFPATNDQVRENTFTHDPPQSGPLIYRVRGLNIFAGVFVQINVDTADAGLNIPDPPTALQLREAFTGTVCKMEWTGDAFQYRIEFHNIGDTVLHFADTVSDTQYDLDVAVARANGMSRQFLVKVFSLASNGQLSLTATQASFSNALPAALTGLTLVENKNTIQFTFDYPLDNDFAGVSVWGSTTPGFTVDDSTRIIIKSLDQVLKTPIGIGQTMHFRAAAHDVWGDDFNISAEFVVVGGTILAGDISDGAITNAKLADLAVTAEKLANGSVESDKIVNAAITNIKIADAAVDTDKLSNLSVEASKLASNSVTSTKIANLAVGNAAIANAAITNAKIANLAVTGAKIDNATIVEANIANAAIGNAAIQNLAVSSAKIQDLAVSTIKIGDNAVNIPTSSFTSGSVNVPVNVLTELRSVTYTSTGQPVFILCSTNLEYIGDENEVIFFRILRNGGLLLQTSAILFPFKDTNFTTTMRDFPGSGSVTYVFQAFTGTGASDDGICSNRHLYVQEVKK